MSERIFDIKIKKFHEMKMGSLIMDSFINIFLVLLHYVPYIKDEKVNIQNFWDVSLQIFEREWILACSKP